MTTGVRQVGGFIDNVTCGLDTSSGLAIRQRVAEITVALRDLVNRGCFNNATLFPYHESGYKDRFLTVLDAHSIAPHALFIGAEYAYDPATMQWRKVVLPDAETLRMHYGRESAVVWHLTGVTGIHTVEVSHHRRHHWADGPDGRVLVIEPATPGDPGTVKRWLTIDYLSRADAEGGRTPRRYVVCPPREEPVELYWARRDTGDAPYFNTAYPLQW